MINLKEMGVTEIKYSVAFAIYNSDRSRFLAVKRPADDEHLPSIWGLPAGSLKNDETPEDAVLRAGKEKLGIELKIVKPIGEDVTEREKYLLHMRLYEAEIIRGEPKVLQPVRGITQYQAWKWATPDDLIEGAKKGSLCCRIYLKRIP